MDDPLLIVGLGNPGPRYETTRHNIGFMVVDAMSRQWEIPLREEGKFEARVGKGTWKKRQVYLMEPTTFMNLSGRALQKFCAYYKIPYEQCLVIYDDIDLPLGKIRFRPDGSAGSHNGMKSVLAETAHASISRLRVGVDPAPPQWDLADYVLAPFPPEQHETVGKVIDLCVEASDYWLRQGTERAMNKYNSVNLLAPPKEKKPRPVADASPEALPEVMPIPLEEQSS